MSQNPSLDSGANNLLDAHINALDENSKRVVEILERLSEVELNPKDRRALKRIKSEYKGIDKRLDSFLKEDSKITKNLVKSENKAKKRRGKVYLEDLEAQEVKEESDWFEF